MTLARANPAIGPVPVRHDHARRIDALDIDTPRAQAWLHVLGDVMFVAAERIDETRQIHARQIVIAGNDEIGDGQALEKGARFLEFGDGGRLGDVAAGDNQIGCIVVEVAQQRVGDRL